MTLQEFKKKMKKIPDGPGVYFFLGKRKEILYIGKAASLRSRVRSYFVEDIAEVRSPLIAQMVVKAKSIDWRQTDSVLEALILEANLIKTHKPRANTDEKDDKSWNYVVITREDFPQVLVMRGKDLNLHDQKEFTAVFGPFPHGSQLKEAMKIVRRIFPYRDEKCRPNQGRPCFNRQIGLCPGICTGEIAKAEYVQAVKHLTLFFQGKKKRLLRELTGGMKTAAKNEDFEKAGELRRQLFALQHIQDISLIKDEFRFPRQSAFGPHSSALYRIEAYDVAHLGGTNTIGVMTVIENNAPVKNEYRTFRIKTAKAGDDVGALREILSRRLAHDEWPMPRLIVVDGAKAQMNGAQKVLQDLHIQIPIVGVIKNERHQPRGISGDTQIIHDYESGILLANAEAHRFAIGRHRRSRGIGFI